MSSGIHRERQLKHHAKVLLEALVGPASKPHTKWSLQHTWMPEAPNQELSSVAAEHLLLPPCGKLHTWKLPGFPSDSVGLCCTSFSGPGASASLDPLSLCKSLWDSLDTPMSGPESKHHSATMCENILSEVSSQFVVEQFLQFDVLWVCTQFANQFCNWSGNVGCNNENWNGTMLFFLALFLVRSLAISVCAGKYFRRWVWSIPACLSHSTCKPVKVVAGRCNESCWCFPAREDKHHLLGISSKSISTKSNKLVPRPPGDLNISSDCLFWL